MALSYLPVFFASREFPILICRVVTPWYLHGFVQEGFNVDQACLYFAIWLKLALNS